MDHIIEILKQEGVEVYRITRSGTRAAELYFIKGQLDMPRLTDMTETRVEVFRDFEEEGKRFRGSTVIFIDPGSSQEEIREKIRSAYYAASFVKNPWYDLPEKTTAPFRESEADYRDMSLTEAAEAVADVLLSVKGTETAFINSAEIFIRRSLVRILDSRGTDVSYGRDSVWGEFVTQCTEPSDVEQYRQFSYGDLDLASLKEKLESGIRDVSLRARAQAAPAAGRHSVILTGEEVRQLLDFYVTRSSSAFIYPGYSTWKLGDDIQGTMDGGERLDLTLTSARPYSEEGIPLKDRPLIRDGRLALIHGGARFASYLGIEPTGSYEKVVLKAGTMPYADMKKTGALEAVSFSDFQMDEMDGHFAGELRLALLEDRDGSVTPLTGGSVNGSLLESQGRLIFSTETFRDSTYEGPLAVLIPDVTIAGS